MDFQVQFVSFIRDPSHLPSNTAKQRPYCAQAVPLRFPRDSVQIQRCLLPNSCNAVYIYHGNSWHVIDLRIEVVSLDSCMFSQYFNNACCLDLCKGKMVSFWWIQNSNVSGHGEKNSAPPTHVYRVVNNGPVKPFKWDISKIVSHPCSKFNFLHASWMFLSEIILTMGGTPDSNSRFAVAVNCPFARGPWPF